MVGNEIDRRYLLIVLMMTINIKTCSTNILQ